MASRLGSVSRSLFSAARTFPTRSSPLRRSIPRTMNLGPLGCTHSLFPLHSAVAVALAPLTSHISVVSRACSHLSQGT